MGWPGLTSIALNEVGGLDWMKLNERTWGHRFCRSGERSEQAPVLHLLHSTPDGPTHALERSWEIRLPAYLARAGAFSRNTNQRDFTAYPIPQRYARWSIGP